MHRNYWLDELRVKDAVKLITGLLNDEFCGEPPDGQKWLDSIEDIIDIMYSDDIVVLAGLIRYEIICELDGYGLVDSLKLIEKII